MKTVKQQWLLLVACLLFSSFIQAKNFSTTPEKIKDSNFEMENLWASPPNAVCGNGALTLKINFDNSPQQVGWEIKDNQLNVVAGQSYNLNNNLIAGDSVLEVIPTLPSGDYVLIVFDRGGDGLCCTNGTGSYKLSDSQNTILTGDVYEFSSVQTFCVGSTNNDVFDLTPPTASVLTANNPTTNSIDLSWTASVDNDVLLGYVIFRDGIYIGDISPTSTSVTFPNLNPNTTYDFMIAAIDITGNFSARSNTATATTAALGDIIPPTTPTNLSIGNITTNSFDLTWDASTDNVGVANYNIYLNGNNYGNTSGTSYSFSGLTANTIYSCYVEAIDVNSNISTPSNTVSATTLPLASTCGNGALTLEINFDNIPQQVAWQIKDNQQNVVAANFYNYNNIPNPNTTITESIGVLPAGDYVLVVFDSGGDGLCCTNGTGSFDLSDTQGTILSGDTYEFSSVQTFCVGSTNNDVFDLTAPTASTITASNPTTSTIDLAWTVATDNDAVLGYVLFINGVYAGDIPFGYTNFTLPNLTPNTSYDFMIASRDLTGNFSAKSNIATETTLGGVTASIIHEGYFETGWDGWIDGGNRANRYSGNKSFEGNYSIRLRDNSGVQSSMTSPTFDLSSADSVNITFQYYTRGFSQGEDFFIKFKQGNSFVNVAQFVKGTDFTTNGFYEATVTVDANALTFGTADQFRIQTDASNYQDKVWVDQVIITSYATGGNSSSKPTPISVGEKNYLQVERPTTTVQTPTIPNVLETPQTKQPQLSVFPNPVKHSFSIQLQGIDVEKIERIMIYDNYGRLVLTTQDTQNINTENLSNGIYHLFIMNKNRKHESIKFIKDDLR